MSPVRARTRTGRSERSTLTMRPPHLPSQRMRILHKLTSSNAANNPIFLDRYSTSLRTKSFGELIAIATIQVARMKNGQSFEVMSGERRGNTTAPNRSAVIRTRLWIDSRTKAFFRETTSLHKAWPRGPFTTQELIKSFCISLGIQIIRPSMSDMAMFTMKKKQWRSGSKQRLFQFFFCC